MNLTEIKANIVATEKELKTSSGQEKNKLEKKLAMLKKLEAENLKVEAEKVEAEKVEAEKVEAEKVATNAKNTLFDTVRSLKLTMLCLFIKYYIVVGKESILKTFGQKLFLVYGLTAQQIATIKEVKAMFTNIVKLTDSTLEGYILGDFKLTCLYNPKNNLYFVQVSSYFSNVNTFAAFNILTKTEFDFFVNCLIKGKANLLCNESQYYSLAKQVSGYFPKDKLIIGTIAADGFYSITENGTCVQTPKGSKVYGFQNDNNIKLRGSVAHGKLWLLQMVSLKSEPTKRGKENNGNGSNSKTEFISEHKDII